MNNINVSTPTKKILLTTIILLLIGAPLLVYIAQQQQIFKQFAWHTTQSAETACSADTGVAINVSFSNTEESMDMNVVAKDLQTGTSVDLGTVVHGQTAKGTIQTGKKTLDKGAVLFTLTWTNGTSGTDTRSAEYKAQAECPSKTIPPYCPTSPDTQGYCKWDKVDGIDSYNVSVIDVETGNEVVSKTIDSDQTQLGFDMIPGKAYQCKVTTRNACGTGDEVKSPEKVCTPETPTPTETPRVCPDQPVKEGICRWDSLEGAREYKVVIKDKDTGEIISEKTVKAPDHELVYPANPGKTYTCTVTGVGECSESKPVTSSPVTCAAPTPTPTPTTVPSGTPTPTVVPSGTPVPPTVTPVPPTPTPTPVPPTPTAIIITATPVPPTPTPVVIVRTPQTPQTIIQQPAQPRTIVQQPAQPQTVVQQPGSQQPVVVQQPAPQQVTPAPTVPATGAASDSLILVGSSVLLLVVGGLLFFAI